MQSYKELQILTKQLAAVDDELDRVLSAMQDDVNALGLGVETWLNTPIDVSAFRDVLDRHQEPTGSREYDAVELGYGRLAERSAFLLRSVRYVEEPDGDSTAYNDRRAVMALVGSALALRVKAVPHIPNLIGQIKREVQETIDTVEQAKQIAGSFK
jgi:hypothetical protein